MKSTLSLKELQEKAEILLKVLTETSDTINIEERSQGGDHV